jgi:hypothetical protein
MHKIKYVFIATLSFLFLTVSAVAAEAKKGDVQSSRALAKSALVGYSGRVSYININSLISPFYWDGVSGYNETTGDGGTIYPRNTGVVVYRDGLVWGGLVRGDEATGPIKRVGGNTYRVGTIPGKIVDGLPEDYDNNDVVRVYRIRADYETVSDAVLQNDAAEVFVKAQGDVTDADIQILREQYARDWADWPVDRGAPFYDLDEDGVYEPQDGETPGFANGDQVLWYVLNDLDAGATANLYGSQPMGLEVQTTVWAYNVSGDQPLGNAFFKKYRVFNKSQFTIDSMYFSQWSDPDLGEYTNDFAGVDTTLSMMFAYNGLPNDGTFDAFNIAPPAVGYDFLQGPIVESPGDQAIFGGEILDGFKNLPATSFSFFSAGSAIEDPALGEYAGTKEWYNMLRGFVPTNTDEPTTSYTNFQTGEATKFPLAGDPVTSQGDVDGFEFGPGDRRMLITSGPITLESGGIQEVVVGEIAAVSKNNRASVAKAKFFDREVQNAYDLFFDVPKPPAAPNFSVTPLEEGKILIEWGNDAAAVALSEQNFANREFEGYNLYQINKQQEVLKIATYDLKNNIAVIFGTLFDDESGAAIYKPVQNSLDEGIPYYHVVDKDAFTETPLYSGSEYTFAVTAYNRMLPDQDPTLIGALESKITGITVKARGQLTGNAINHEAGEHLTITHTSGVSTGFVTAIVADPSVTKTQTFEVAFTDSVTWDLNNVTTGQTILTDQVSETYEYTSIIDGVIVTAGGPTTAGLAGYDYDGNRWISGVDWGGQEFFGGLDIGANFFGSTLTLAELVPIQLVFQDQAGVDADGYISKGAIYRRDQGYAYGGTGELPFAAYDMTNPDSPRRVNICFVESDGAGGSTANGIWDMGWLSLGGSWPPDGLGAREYIFIMKSDYNEGADYDGTNDGTGADVVFAIWPKERSRDYLLAEFTMDIFVNIKNTANDKFQFSTTAPTIGDRNLAKADIDKMTIWPNPYYGSNPEETSSFGRFVQITHLPKEATVRIFNLGGSMVRKIEKNNETPFLEWDLNNDSGIPVGSGIYVVHVDMPGYGEKILKVTIIQPQQKLQYF